MDSYLKQFLDDNGYSQNAVIYGVDMKSRADRMYTQGKAGTDVSQSTIDDIGEKCEGYLSDKYYYKAFSTYVKKMNMCMTTNMVKKLTYKMWIKLIIASGVAVAAVLTMMHNAKARMTVSSIEYTKDHNFKVNDRRDVLINTTVVTRHIEHNNSSGSSGGGGGNSGYGGHF